MSPPASVKVMHLIFSLRFVDGDIADQAGALGWCNKTEQVITIRKDLRPRLLCDTFCHEVTHACFFAAGIADEGLTEEQVASQLTGPLLCVFSENPEVVRWLHYLLNSRLVVDLGMADIDTGAYQ